MFPLALSLILPEIYVTAYTNDKRENPYIHIVYQ